MDIITVDDCKKWTEYPNINPRTQRKISTYGKVYEMFRKQSCAYGLETAKNSMCQSKWVTFNSDEATIYNKSLIKTCKHCKKYVSYSVLHFIHARDETAVADYECVRCKESGNLAYFCVKCRNMDED